MYELLCHLNTPFGSGYACDRGKMKIKTTTNYWLTVALALLAILLAVSALLLWVIFPRGFFPSRVLWVEIHKWVGLALLTGVTLHVVLHWKWLVQMTRHYISRWRKETRRGTRP